ncbi:pentatricopeptide repeat-containing protein At4g39952, mitochondrial-like [Quercus robur]|uniref:pentatricopeptide repeat-containing protein At4g39952, mitochondrial-like n=1 Tax=Quercus robur TaxID=38942 RepID=UPI002162F5AA|nr:pentatricopeptide repeat-containing protein At4g39952, mitochondrial-like [Quercus robur]
MLCLKLTHIFKRFPSSLLFSTYSTSNYLNCYLNYFLSNQTSTLQSLLQSHALIIASGNSNNLFIASKLISLYSSLNKPTSSTKVFDSVSPKDTFLWNSVIKSHFSNGNYSQALEFHLQMRAFDTPLDQFTIPMVVSTCAELMLLDHGKNIHGLVLKLGLFAGNSAVGSSFVYMYVKCAQMDDAYLMFDEMCVRDVVAWTALVIGYVQNNESEKGLECLCDMHSVGGDGERPTFRTLEGGFQACGNLGALVEEKLFRRVPEANKDSWNNMIFGYSMVGLEAKCIELFREMQWIGIQPDSNSLVSMVSSCSQLGGTYLGRSLHCYIIEHSMDENVMVVSSLMDMYVKAGNLNIAWKIFCGTQRDIITWNTLISSYTYCGRYAEAVALFEDMISENLQPNSVVLSACSHLASLEKGERIHHYIKERGIESNISLATALVEMYAKCGQLEKARKLFNTMKERDVISWNVIISGYGMNGHAKSAMEIFQQMDKSNVKPNGLTFLALLSACAHAGLVKEWKGLFNRMQDYSIKPNLKHYACMIDLLGRSGNLQEAEALVLSMPFSPDGGVWGALLSACKIHNEIETGVRIAKYAIETDPENDGYYIMMCNMYNSVGRWEEAERVREMMNERNVAKRAGWSTL